MSTEPYIAPPFGAAMLEKLLELNNQNALALVFETEANFSDVLRRASFLRARPDGAALLVGFHQDCDYDSPNFQWFRKRYQHFNYIDRIVVSEALRGQGLARKLYAAFEADARENRRERLVCEINSEPPNPGSEKFHQALGFKQVGAQRFEAKGKTVSYWTKELG